MLGYPTSDVHSCPNGSCMSHLNTFLLLLLQKQQLCLPAAALRNVSDACLLPNSLAVARHFWTHFYTPCCMYPTMHAPGGTVLIDALAVGVVPWHTVLSSTRTWSAHSFWPQRALCTCTHALLVASPGVLSVLSVIPTSL
jgi:hypothetical protein